jgi:hypothetical protein
MTGREASIRSDKIIDMDFGSVMRVFVRHTYPMRRI